MTPPRFLADAQGSLHQGSRERREETAERMMEEISEAAKKVRAGGMENPIEIFECSPGKTLRSYLAKSIRPLRMWQPLCSKSDYTPR